MTLGVQVCLLISWHEYSLHISRVVLKEKSHVMNPCTRHGDFVRNLGVTGMRMKDHHSMEDMKGQ